MSDKFDPATHTFGMAYLNWNKEVCYPTQLKQHGVQGKTLKYMIPCVVPGYKTVHSSHIENLTRSPEHDLIPRADYQPAAKVDNYYLQPDRVIGEIIVILSKSDPYQSKGITAKNIYDHLAATNRLAVPDQVAVQGDVIDAVMYQIMDALEMAKELLPRGMAFSDRESPRDIVNDAISALKPYMKEDV